MLTKSMKDCVVGGAYRPAQVDRPRLPGTGAATGQGVCEIQKLFGMNDADRHQSLSSSTDFPSAGSTSSSPASPVAADS
jgi:hypothetical protein